ncbi:hypothetical protein CEXT_702201 [Caerostris extrusa]|uniref:Uncharacterized protein n=1 Tax=Caerostris extrusa TaxID=172846 RepID=A0AAV4XV10_CAEEX|nr:hypothetical protein CEXT_702201 [Caerostris extrusa]
MHMSDLIARADGTTTKHQSITINQKNSFTLLSISPWHQKLLSSVLLSISPIQDQKLLSSVPKKSKSPKTFFICPSKHQSMASSPKTFFIRPS